MVPRTPAASALIFSLDFDIYRAAAVIDSQDIQSYRASLQALYRMLRLCRYDFQVSPVHYDVQDQLYTFRAALHALIKKIVIHEPQLLDFVQA